MVRTDTNIRLLFWYTNIPKDMILYQAFGNFDGYGPG